MIGRQSPWKQQDRGWPLDLELCAGVISVAAAWLLFRPYTGIAWDAIIYVGRAMADLDPAGVGRQLDYAHDGQSGFSVYPDLLQCLAMYIGLGRAAEVFAALGVSCWLAAAAFMVSRFVKGARLWAVLMCMAVIPADYGFQAAFHYGEALATPRALAEAAGMAAIGLFTCRRTLAGFAAAGTATALHPLMGLPVVVLLMVQLGMSNQRWWFAYAAGLALLIYGAASGAPVAGRLFQRFDPVWRELIDQRAPLVFISLWSPETWARLTCQAASVLLAGMMVENGSRRLLLTACVVTLAGITISLIPSVLIVQLQPWRAQWLLAVMANGAFPYVVGALWSRGDVGRASAAFLCVAWIGCDSPPTAMIAAAVSVGLACWPKSHPIGRPLVIALCALATGVAIAIECVGAVTCLGVINSAPRYPHSSIIASGLLFMPIVAGVMFIIAKRPDRPGLRWRIVTLTGASAMLLVALWTWDDRPPETRWAETLRGPPPLHSFLRSGSVYWVGSRSTSWLITGLPEWLSTYQGAGLVFDRDEALEWARRHRISVDIGLVSSPGRLTLVQSAALYGLCRVEHGPRWVISPLAAVSDPKLLSMASVWQAPVAERTRTESGLEWMTVRDYAIFDCELAPKVNPAKAF